MGIVYRGHDRERNAPVALKLLRKTNPETLLRFKREFRALTDLSHRNLVSLYELVSQAKHWFFAMELIEGDDFLTYVRDGSSGGATDIAAARGSSTSVGGGTATPDTGSTVPTGVVRNTNKSHPRRRRWKQYSLPLDHPAQFSRLRATLRQLVEGLMALHHAGIVHRDIKPSNVMVTSAGRVVILDFGVVAQLAAGDASSEGQNKIIGTPGYMAPEYAGRLSGASDWYSLGVMLYEALVGRRPFLGDTARVLTEKAARAAPDPGHSVPEAPDDLISICNDLLLREPGRRPDGDALLLRLGGRRSVRRRGVARSSSELGFLVGREPQLRRLRSAFADSLDSAPRVALVHGKSGVGKTSLVTRFLADLRNDGRAVVLKGRCFERETVPYKAIDSLIDALVQHLRTLAADALAGLVPANLGELVRLFPVLRTIAEQAGGLDSHVAADPHESRQRAFVALRTLLVRLSATKPLVLYIDDLQWADGDSAALLSDVLRPPFDARLMLVASFRTDGDERFDKWPIVEALRVAAGELVDIPLDPLSTSDASLLASELLRRSGADEASAPLIAEESAGNPFLVTEIAEHVADKGGGQAHPELVVSLEDVLRHRISELPGSARLLLDAVAVAGKPIVLSDALHAADITVDASTALGFLRSARLVRSVGPADSALIETYHDRVRDAVVAAIDAGKLRRVHRTLALSLELGSNADVETLAVHYDRADEPSRAADYYEIAADLASTALAFERAARLFGRAVTLRHRSRAPEPELLAKHADALTNAGRGVEAAPIYERAAVATEGATSLRYRGRAAEELMRSGRIDEGLEAIARVLGQVAIKVPSSKAARLLALGFARGRVALRGLRYVERSADEIPPEQLTVVDACWVGSVVLGMGDHLLGSIFQARHLHYALAAGELRHVARALAVEIVFVSVRGAPARAAAERLSRQAMELAERTNDPLTHAWALGSAGLASFQFGNWRRALDSGRRAERELRDHCTGGWWEVATINIYCLWALFHLGEVGALSRRVPELLREAKARGDRYLATNLSVGLSNLAWLVRDDVEGSRAVAEEAIASWSRRGYQFQHYWSELARSHRCIYVGDGEAALAQWKTTWRHAKSAWMFRIQGMRIEAAMARGRSALCAADARANASHVRSARADAKRLERERVPHAAAFALMLRAGIAHTQGDLQRAQSVLARAAVACDETEMALCAAVARRCRGALLGGDEGAALIAAADRFLQEQHVANPERMCALVLPGFAHARRA